MKILHITGILAVVLTGLLIILIVTDLADTRQTEQTQEFSIIEKFRRTVNKNTHKTYQQVSPLVQEAQEFALYLNPPSPVRPDLKLTFPNNQNATTEKHNDFADMGGLITNQENTATLTSDSQTLTSLPKFELHGISYYRSKPEKSMAFIWEPDVGYRWVRKDSRLGGLIFKQINSASILYQDGKLTKEIMLKPNLVSTRLASIYKEKPVISKPVMPQHVVSKSQSIHTTKQMSQELVSAKKEHDLWELNIGKKNNISKFILTTEK
jgi:hypothetical protein